MENLASSRSPKVDCQNTLSRLELKQSSTESFKNLEFDLYEGQGEKLLIAVSLTVIQQEN